jgi:GNAT superfamily N-acetyltransferase
MDIIRFDPQAHSVSDLTAFLHRAYAPLAEQGLRYVATWQDDTVTRKRISGGECYAAFQEGLPVATVVFRDPANTRGCPWYDRPDVAMFGQFAVAPELQGRGLGSELLALCERRASETGAAELACDTAEPAANLIRYYCNRGFRVVETAQWETTNYRSVILSKRVAP